MKNILNEKKKKYFEIKNKKKSEDNQNSVQNENNIFIFNNINQYTVNQEYIQKFKNFSL